jgi:hypothetical protein
MSEEAPKFVPLENSLELSEFHSEAELSAETDRASDTLLVPRTDATAVDEAVAPDAGQVEPPDQVSLFAEEQAPTNETPPERPGPTVEHVGPATVTEFPLRQQLRAAVALPSLPSGPASLVELIERRGGLEWREAVAVIHQICLYLRDHERDREPQAPILLDPRNIQITDKGQVQLLSGQTSSDPLVIQVGRLLRTMLMGNEAPPELRLLLAQATFELPIFESIEDVDRALAQLNKLDDPGPEGQALLRAVAAPPEPPNPGDEVRNRPASIRSILPAQRGTARRPRSMTSGLGSLLGSYGSQVAIIFIGIAVVGGLLVARSPILFPRSASSMAPAPAAPVVIAPAVPAATVANPQARVSTGPNGSDPPAQRTPVAQNHTPVAITPPMGGRSPVGGRSPAVGVPSRAGRTHRPSATAGTLPATASSVATIGTPLAPVPAVTSPRDSERRAASLLELGKTAAASFAFDALVMSNPLYEPKATDLTPEALAAFRTSQRQLLPSIAQRHYDRAVAALAAGDADRALALGKETAAILDRSLPNATPQFREQVADLVEEATAAAAAANEVIYSGADVGVIPPRPLSRQLPVTGPIGVPPHRVGWLEIVVNRDGTVFSIKLHTPLNRHHERMIVSPAKAWLYRPATKNGKPVMYRILVKVNLPESGT